MGARGLEISGTSGPDSAGLLVAQHQAIDARSPGGSLVVLSDLGGLDVHDNEGRGVLVSRALLMLGGVPQDGARLALHDGAVRASGFQGVASVEAAVELRDLRVEASHGAGVWAAGVFTTLVDVEIDGVDPTSAGLADGLVVQGSPRWWPSAEDALRIERLAVRDAQGTGVRLSNADAYYGGQVDIAVLEDNGAPATLEGLGWVTVDGAARALTVFTEVQRPEAPNPLSVEMVPATVGCRPSVERCNAVDDDCDGKVDEAFPDLGGSAWTTARARWCAIRRIARGRSAPRRTGWPT